MKIKISKIIAPQKLIDINYDLYIKFFYFYVVFKLIKVRKDYANSIFFKNLNLNQNYKGDNFRSNQFVFIFC